MRVAIIIVTYNAAKYIPDCFGSLSRLDRTGLDVDVIVIENASKDDTVQMLKAYPFAETHVMDSNLGFAGGNNVGIRLAMERGADYVYLLNHDTVITPTFLTEAIRMAESDPKIGAVQSLLLLWPDKELVNSTGNAVHFLGLGYCMDYRRPVSSLHFDGRREIAYASGAGVLLRVAALRAVGLFDERLFMYHEDLDLGWRLRLAGYVNVLAPASVVHHKYEFSRSIGKYYYMERNRYIVLLKNFRPWTLVVLSPFLLVSEVALLIAAFRSGWWREKLRVYAYFIRPSTWRSVAKERRRVNALRRVGDREIVRLFTSVISYQEVAGWFTTRIANPLMTATWSVIKLFIVS